jgi:hypothetical protein
MADLKIKDENDLAVFLNGWRKNYISLTTTAVAETFFFNGKEKFEWICKNCKRKLITTKNFIQLNEQNADKYTVFKLKGKLLVCRKCYKANNYKKITQIAFKYKSTKVWKKAVMKAYRYLLKLYNKGFFVQMERDGKFLVFYF